MVTLEEHDFTWAAGEKKTAYLAAGPKEGPLLIFIHGWPAIAYTWKPQLETFASLGFRVIAPDMPGYGNSSARKITSDYNLETITTSLLSLLTHLSRPTAIWIGHDWGCAAVYAFAQHHPSHVTAVAGLAVPSHTLELGLSELLKYADRDLYPLATYPYAQWDYMQFYIEDFDRATGWFDRDPAAFLRVGFVRGSGEEVGKVAFTAVVRAQGGWFGGIEKPDSTWREIPSERLCVDEETYGRVVEAMEKTGFFGACSWYNNHEANRKFFLEKAVDGGRLRMPVLFVGARFDTVCDERLAVATRRNCERLTECSIDAGHWVQQEKPAEVNGIIARWIVEEVPTAWPGYLDNKGVVKSKG